MGSTRGTFRGASRRGSAAGILALLLFGIAPALPVAFGDSHRDGDGDDRAQPAHEGNRGHGQDGERGHGQESESPQGQASDPADSHGSDRGHGDDRGHKHDGSAADSGAQPSSPSASGGRDDDAASSARGPKSTSDERTADAAKRERRSGRPAAKSAVPEQPGVAAPAAQPEQIPAASSPASDIAAPRQEPASHRVLKDRSHSGRIVKASGRQAARARTRQQRRSPAGRPSATSRPSTQGLLAVAPVAAPAIASPGEAAAVSPPPAQAGRAPEPPSRERGSGRWVLPMVLSALSETIAVIPRAFWIALAALAIFAAFLLGFAVARDRKARGLVRERDTLAADLEVLENAVLPALPEALGGLALSVTTVPCAGVSGGDFHDAFTLSRDRAAVILGDVSGSGRQALADAQLVRHAVRAYLEAGLDPRSALAMTAAVVDEREEPLFASVIVAVHDRRDGTLTFASAGHEPPIFVTEHGAGLPPVTGWSPPLGTGLETGRRQTSIPFPEGTAVCLVTDGVTEARSDGERLGVSRAIRWLSALGSGAMSSDVVARLRAEAEADDDVTVCMLRALTPTVPSAPRIEEAVVEGGDPTYLVRFLRDCGLPLADAEEAGEALAAAPDGTRMIASVEIRGGRAVVELAPLRGSASLVG